MRREGKKLAKVARLWARGQLHIPAPDEPDEDEEVDAALAAFGLRRAEADEVEADEAEPGEAEAGKTEPQPDKCYLWPCNVRAWNIWRGVQTQWRVSLDGREGLDYDGVESYLRSVPGFRPKARAELFFCLRAMERAALDEWEKKRNKG